MDRLELYRDIAERTQGDIYIGVVGPVRTGKSTFIKRFMDLLALPAIENEYIRQRVIDELPQAGAGKTIMTTQPKFVPNEAVQIELDENTIFRLRMVDCVGYMVPGAMGYIENEVPRMVRTPWFDYDIPFEEAAEIGTRKVITDHSTIGIVMTTDGSITQIPRSSYITAEERVISELKECGKPFLIVLNSTNPRSEDAVKLQQAMEAKYNTAVILMDVMNMSQDEVTGLLEQALMEFPIRMIHISIPDWMQVLRQDHWLIQKLIRPLSEGLNEVGKMRDYEILTNGLSNIENFEEPGVDAVEFGTGNINISMKPNASLFYSILSEECGCEVKDDFQLFAAMKDFVAAKKEYDKLSDALYNVHNVGYGIVSPAMDEMELDVPQIVQHGSRFGVRLRARASGIHMIRVDFDSEISPLIGTEEQSEELVDYLVNTFENEPDKIWQTNIFGKPLYDLVRDGMKNKVSRMPEEVQQKIQETLQRIVNEGCNGLICIML
ncbi:MAG: Stage IV sporulation protein A [Firmicutes bacterium ADurb.Bin182]|nr:MAG: Stage IV sporulation protein A [Firmicutes bacterium ADurb.Bin182]